MRMLSLPLALMLALSMTACKQTQTKQSADTSVASTSVPAAAGSGVQPPDLRTPEQKQAEARLKASKQLMINDLNAVLIDLDKQGIKVKKTPQKKPWRLIVPSLQKVPDPEARHTQAAEIAQNFRTKVEKIMERSIDVDVFADDKETQKLN
ncbi:MAG TPA: hypothetical protein V6D05_11735 [Stenomitos sp.]